MNFTDCINENHSILMEGALGERIKREYHLKWNDDVCGTDHRHMEQLAKIL